MARGWREEFLIVVQLKITFSVTDLPMVLLRKVYVSHKAKVYPIRQSRWIIFCGEIPARVWGGDLDYFWKSKFLIFQDSYNLVFALFLLKSQNLQKFREICF